MEVLNIDRHQKIRGTLIQDTITDFLWEGGASECEGFKIGNTYLSVMV